jgi:L-ribulokinase
MAHLSGETYRPSAAARAAYEPLYDEYVRLHDLFGRGGADAMRSLRDIRESVLAQKADS